MPYHTTSPPYVGTHDRATHASSILPTILFILAQQTLSRPGVLLTVQKTFTVLAHDRYPEEEMYILCALLYCCYTANVAWVNASEIEIWKAHKFSKHL